MARSGDQIPDETGQVAVVAGPHCPRGHATVRHLAGRGATVVMVGGDRVSLSRLRLNLYETVPTANIEIVPIAEPTMTGIVNAAKSVLAVHGRIDVVVNNTSPVVPVDDPPQDATPAASISALGHLACTVGLLPGLTRSPHGRVVTVMTVSDERDAEPPPPPEDDSDDSLAALSLLDFPFELRRRLTRLGSRVESLGADPGRPSSSLTTSLVDTVAPGPLASRLARRVADRRAAPQLQAATDPDAHSGQLWTPMFNTSGKPMRLSLRPPDEPTTARCQWDVAERHCGLSLIDVIGRTNNP